MSGRLRSLHLPSETSPQAVTGGTNPADTPVSNSRPEEANHLSHNGVIPINVRTLVLLGIFLSLFFIGAISASFAGADEEDSNLSILLHDVAQTEPGIVLLGENVDVDVEGPSVSVRWSILACGNSFVLPGSEGVHGNKLCGLPASPLNIFVDNAKSPIMTYDPSWIPVSDGKRLSVQNLVQFDSNHALDVHASRLYPFDTYQLSTAIRATSFTNETLPIQRLSTIDMTSSFYIKSNDLGSLTTLPSSNGTDVMNQTRNLDLEIRRPGEARLFTMMLFIVNWMLTHLAIVCAVISWKYRPGDLTPTIKYLAFGFAVMIGIPQTRRAMPDAPGLDGVLIDSIGFFPQMCIVAFSIAIMLVLFVSREFDLLDHQYNSTTTPNDNTITPAAPNTTTRSAPRRSISLLSPAATRTRTSSLDVTAYEVARLMKYMKGEYVFPPPPLKSVGVHQRGKSIKFGEAAPEAAEPM